MGARWIGIVILGGVVGVATLAGCASDTGDEEDVAQTSDDLSGGPVYKGGSTTPRGPASKIVCGYGCPAGYTAQQPLCISTCGGCSPYGRNATQCVRSSAASVQCGFGCPTGQYVVQRLCISTCGGCNAYGSNAVQCSR